MSMEGKDESNGKAKIYFYLHLLTKTSLLDINFSNGNFRQENQCQAYKYVLYLFTQAHPTNLPAPSTPLPCLP